MWRSTRDPPPPPSLSSLVRHLAESLVDRPEAVTVREVESSPAVVIELRVDRDDLGKVIGKRGSTARALRTVLSAAASRTNTRAILNIVEE